MTPLGRLLREPLVVFLVGGALIFGVDALWAERGRGEEIVVDGAWAGAIEAEVARGRGREPSAAEVAAGIAAAVDEERLYREGLARGLDRGDPIVRRRVIQKMRFVHEERGEAAALDEAALEAWLTENAARYEVPEQVAITQVFAAGAGAEAEARSREMLAALEAGGDPAGLGDPSPHGGSLGLRPRAALAGLFGEDFAAAVMGLEVGRWTRLRSSHGWHAVRVDARARARAPRLAEIRGKVAADAVAASRGAALRKGMEELRRRYPRVLEGVRPEVASALGEGSQ